MLAKKKTKALVSALALIALSSLAAVLLARMIINERSQGFLHDAADTIPSCDVALVLGCSRYLENGRDNLFFKYRIASAAELYHAGKVEFLLVSGDNHVEAYDEPTDMKQALIELRVPANKIVCDYAGFSTLDSVVRAKEIFGQKEIIVVSQEFHNRRAIFIGRSKGVDIYGYNATNVSGHGSFRTMIREELARVKTVLDIWLLNRSPRYLGESILISIHINRTQMTAGRRA